MLFLVIPHFVILHLLILYCRILLSHFKFLAVTRYHD